MDAGPRRTFEAHLRQTLRRQGIKGAVTIATVGGKYFNPTQVTFFPAENR